MDLNDDEQSMSTPALNGPAGTGWTHVSVGVSSNDIILCWTEFDSDLSNMTTSCNT